MYIEIIMYTLQLMVACTCVVSERLLAQGKLSGWLWSIVASVTTGIFFLIRGHFGLMLVEILNIPFAVYGFEKWKHRVEKITKTDNRMALSAGGIILFYFLFGESDEFEKISSSAFLLASLLIARNKKMGWYMAIGADIVLMYVLLKSSDYIFVCFQAISIYISLRKVFFESPPKLPPFPSVHIPIQWIFAELPRVIPQTIFVYLTKRQTFRTSGKAMVMT